MQNQNNSLQPIHIIAVIFTFIFSVLCFHFLAPEHIDEKAQAVLAPLTQSEEVIEVKKPGLPQSLKEYIEKEREARLAKEQEDQIAYDDLGLFQKEQTQEVGQVLSKRFKLPQVDGDLKSETFQTPAGLENMVQFWTHMFGLYTLDHAIFYHERDVGIVYSVLDFSDVSDVEGQSVAYFKKQTISEERVRIKKMIKKVLARLKVNDGKLTGLSTQEMRLAKLFIEAKDRVTLTEEDLFKTLKYRKGFAHRIKQAIVQSGRYMKEMRRIFSERGLPEELTIIPFIESSFSLKAYSSAGAAGIWQFIKATGKRYLRIDDFVDERYDPILAAYAAATHLYNEYKLLGTWPMTINAYNTGPGRLMQARKELQTTDIVKIIKEFNGAGYGHDSKNYYPEFLAALNVYNNYEHYFGDIEPLPLEEFEYVVMPSAVNLKEMARLAGIKYSELVAINLGLKPEVVSGHKKLPKGYLLKIKPDSKKEILMALREVHREVQFATHHIVRKGESLRKIGRIYDFSMDELATLNHILPKQKLDAGQIIKLPSRDGFEYSSLVAPSDEQVVPDDLNTPVF